MKRINPLFILFLSGYLLYGQVPAGNPVDIYNASKIIWYGYDFSQLKLTNYSRIDNARGIKYKYSGAWFELLNDKVSEQRLKTWLNKQFIVYNTESVEQRYSLIPDDSWIVAEPFRLEVDSIPGIISQYDHKYYDGIGFVIIIENFNKYRESASAYFTFFDIKSNEILICRRVEGEAGGFGLTEHWGSAILNAMKYYFRNDYKSDARKR